MQEEYDEYSDEDDDLHAECLNCGTLNRFPGKDIPKILCYECGEIIEAPTTNSIQPVQATSQHPALVVSQTQPKDQPKAIPQSHSGPAPVTPQKEKEKEKEKEKKKGLFSRKKKS